MTVGVLGLGKLGLPFAAALSKAGWNVLGWDRDGGLPVSSIAQEDGLAATLTDYPIVLAEDAAELRRECRLVFVIVPTPSLDDGTFDTAQMVDAIRSLDGDTPLTVAVVSTVSPGSCRSKLQPATDAIGARLVYCPVMIALGSVLSDLEHARVWILGCDLGLDARGIPDPRDIVARYLYHVGTRAHTHRVSFESAEIAKLTTNAFLTVKISYANELGRVCHGTPGASVTDVLAVLRNQPHIFGVAGLEPGGGFGGPCLPRDGFAYVNVGGALGGVASASNDAHEQWVLDWVMTRRDFWTHKDREATRYAVLGDGYSERSGYDIDSFAGQLRVQLDRRSFTPAYEIREADLVIIALPCRDRNLTDALKPDAHVLDLWRTHGYLAAEIENYTAFGETL